MIFKRQNMNTEKRKQRLIELLNRMNGGSDISARDLKIVLTDEQHADFLERWDVEKDKRSPDKPKSVIEYEKLINQWHMAEARLEKYRKRVNKNPRVFQKMVNSIDGYLEDIQQYLTEHRKDFEFNLWLDRTNEADNPNKQIDPSNPANSLDTPPMVITSRSHHKQSSGFLVRYSKRELKKQALEDALSELEQPLAVSDVDSDWAEIRRTIGNRIDKAKLKGIKV